MSMGRLDGKVALITGGSQGQGAEHAKLLAAEGAAVMISDVRDPSGSALAEEIWAAGGRAEYIHLDVQDDDNWIEAVSRTESTFGKLDVLVNNAGIVTYSPVTKCSDEEWNRTIAINQTGVFLGMRAAIPAMQRAGGGAIVNVSSVFGGLRGVDGYIAYGASKAAVHFMTKSAAMTYGPDNIRVNAIAPGALDTPMLREEAAHHGLEADTLASGQPIARLAHPSETSTAVLYLVSDEASYVTGTLLTVDGGLTIGTP